VADSGAIAVRPEAPGDGPQVRRIVEAAFGRAVEADLVEALRRDGDLPISLVAWADGASVGYVGLPRMRSPDRSLALAPVAVSPEWQGRGVGHALINAGLEAARMSGAAIIFVLGEPQYYGRFGFTAEAATAYPCVFSGPYFMALKLSPDAPEPGLARFAQPFDGLA